MRRWVRTRANTWPISLMDSYHPGDEVVVMPAADADEMLAILGRVGHMVPKLIQPSKLERDAYALLARLALHPQGDGQ